MGPQHVICWEWIFSRTFVDFLALTPDPVYIFLQWKNQTSSLKKKGLAHQKLVEAFLHTGKHFRKLWWVLNNAMCCGWTFWFYQAFEFFFYSISFVQIFWFYPYICTVLYAPPPPYLFVQIVCVILSSWNWGGGEMLIDLFIYPPPPQNIHGPLYFLSLFPPPCL